MSENDWKRFDDLVCKWQLNGVTLGLSIGFLVFSAVEAMPVVALASLLAILVNAISLYGHPRRRTPWITHWIVFYLLTLLALLGLACGSARRSEAMTPSESAWYSCTLTIEDQLGLSFLSAEDYEPSQVYSVAGGTTPLRSTTAGTTESISAWSTSAPMAMLKSGSSSSG